MSNACIHIIPNCYQIKPINSKHLESSLGNGCKVRNTRSALRRKSGSGESGVRWSGWVSERRAGMMRKWNNYQSECEIGRIVCFGSIGAVTQKKTHHWHYVQNNKTTMIFKWFVFLSCSRVEVCLCACTVYVQCILCITGGAVWKLERYTVSNAHSQFAYAHERAFLRFLCSSFLWNVQNSSHTISKRITHGRVCPINCELSCAAFELSPFRYACAVDAARLDNNIIKLRQFRTMTGALAQLIVHTTNLFIVRSTPKAKINECFVHVRTRINWSIGCTKIYPKRARYWWKRC